MRLINKKGQVESGEMVSLIFTLLILIIYIIFIVFGSFNTGEIESIVIAKDNIYTYTYYPDLVNYLNTEVKIDDKDISMFEIFKEYISNGDNEDIIKEKTSEFLDKISHCYYDNGKVKKVGFILFLSNGKKWDNIPFYKQWKIYNLPIGKGFVSLGMIPKQDIGPVAFQKITEENYVYLYREEGIKVNKKECDNLE